MSKRMNHGEAPQRGGTPGRVSAARAARYARLLQQSTRLAEHLRAAMAENGHHYTARTMDEALDALQAAQEALAQIRASSREPPERPNEGA